jgi:putative oxidoreductase
VRALLRNPWVHAAAAILLGGVFLYACYEKIWLPSQFARIVYRYSLVGPSARLGYVPANVFAVVLPWVELLTGVLLVVGVWRREAAAVAGSMLAMFVVAIGYALFQGIDIANCGCFSVNASAGDSRAVGLKLIVQDLGLLLLAVYVAAVEPAPRAATADSPSDDPVPSRALPG